MNTQKITLSPYIENFIRNNHAKMSNNELYGHVSRNLKKHICMHTFREKVYAMGLKKCKKPKQWTEAETNFLIDNYIIYGNTELAEKLNKKPKPSRHFTKKHVEKKLTLLGLKRSEREVNSVRQRNIRMGLYHRGQRLSTEKKRMPDGTIKVWACNGYERKYIKKDGVWKLLSAYIWEKNFGKPQKNDRIIPIDCDYFNCNISNLKKIPVTELLLRSRHPQFNSFKEQLGPEQKRTLETIIGLKPINSFKDIDILIRKITYYFNLHNNQHNENN